MSQRESGAGSTVLGSSAVMAAGTVVSRMTGFGRGMLLVAALGTQLHADVFTIANTVPNMLYILLAGGVFNAVLVPQLVRAMKHDADGGEAYTNRVITLAALFLAGVTAVLVIGAPWLMQVFLAPGFDSPSLAAERDSVIDFARYCLPQVFFYGMFVLVGQILNARGRFGPMMWAPIANNLIAIAVLTGYLFAFGTQECGGFSSGEELLLGLGSTLGIAAQLAILVPYLKRAGFTFRPRFDFRNTGLGHTLRLGVWTVLFVIVNQVAYTVVVNLASSGTAQAALACGSSTASAGTGYTIYSNAFLVIMVPHSIATVSLATAMLPRLSAAAADRDLRALGSGVAAMMRTTYALVVPVAALIPVVALDVANLTFGYGAAGSTFSLFAPTLSLFALGLLFFTSHYLMLRGFYALERTRLVFGIQCVVAVVNIVVAVALTRGIDPGQTAPRLVVAYSAAYAVGAVVSFAVLSRLVGGLEGGRLLRYAGRLLLAVAVATGIAWVGSHGVHALLGDGKLEALVAVLVALALDVAVFATLARLLRIGEVTEVVALVTRRLGRAR
ncbi:MAG: integral rane protein MviN [Nocardioidaceae bacterium]|nr:integral rane protein MviN [Nocardioidaceae bacterium]